MSSYFNHSVANRRFLLYICWSAVLGACQKDEPQVEELKPDQSIAAQAPDMGPPTPLKTPIAELFRYIPDPPAGVRARAGEDASPIISAQSIKKIDGFSRLFRETIETGAFHQVQYLLTEDQKTIKQVIATFKREYDREEHLKTMLEILTIRLGKPKTDSDDKMLRYVWSLPNFGIEIRRDLASAKFKSSRPLTFVYDINSRSTSPIR